ncbi:MAG: hypothetical protein GMKNLPBB_02425 [Myxococcota bacterium]|nr:hypothetical protein [Myxococcota bacterium]
MRALEKLQGDLHYQMDELNLLSLGHGPMRLIRWVDYRPEQRLAGAPLLPMEEFGGEREIRWIEISASGVRRLDLPPADEHSPRSLIAGLPLEGPVHHPMNGGLSMNAPGRGDPHLQINGTVVGRTRWIAAGKWLSAFTFHGGGRFSLGTGSEVPAALPCAILPQRFRGGSVPLDVHGGLSSRWHWDWVAWENEQGNVQSAAVFALQPWWRSLRVLRTSLVIPGVGAFSGGPESGAFEYARAGRFWQSSLWRSGFHLAYRATPAGEFPTGEGSALIATDVEVEIRSMDGPPRRYSGRGFSRIGAGCRRWLMRLPAAQTRR